MGVNVCQVDGVRGIGHHLLQNGSMARMTTYPGETWLPVVDYEEFYEVSDFGRIRRTMRRKGPPGKNWPYLQPVRQRSGHLAVTLYRDGTKKLAKIHLLVMAAFAGPRPGKLITRHLNGDPADNRLVNLAYGTHKENLRDDIRHGVLRSTGKTRCPKGHEYNLATTYFTPGDRSRSCRICRREAFERYVEKTQAPGAPRCCAPDCGNGAFTKGLCRRHYDQQRRSPRQ